MSKSIELTTLSAQPNLNSTFTEPSKEQGSDGAVSTWAYAAAALLLVLASCLILFPSFLLFISEPTDRRTSLTSLESFLALHFGISLTAIAISLVLNTPSSEINELQNSTASNHPLIAPLSIAASITAFLSFNTKSVGHLASIFFAGSIAISLWGIWAIVFGSSSLVSKKTGADKHTSSFIFGNKSAASIKKKQWKKERKNVQ